MDIAYYLQKFQESADELNKQLFNDNGLQIKIGMWMDSVVLKIQNNSWLNPNSSKPFQESVFFSVWVSNESLAKDKLYYNIHALKMRELKAYNIQSRDFAEAFRARFKSYQSKWPNVSVQYGPLTLMEGWVPVSEFESMVPHLSTNFIELAGIIDDLLTGRKKLIH